MHLACDCLHKGREKRKKEKKIRKEKKEGCQVLDNCQDEHGRH